MATSGPIQPPAAQRPSPSWPLDIAALETGLLGDPSTSLVTAFARTTAGPASADEDGIATVATAPLPPSPTAPTPSSDPAVAERTDPDSVGISSSAIGRRPHTCAGRPTSCKRCCKREAHETQTLFTRYETLCRQSPLGARERAELHTLAALLAQRSAQLAQWRATVQQHLLDARTHEEAAASLLRAP